MMIASVQYATTYLIAALLHSLWQGAFVAAAVFFLLRRIPARQARLRSGVALGGLAAVVVAAVVTYSALAYFRVHREGAPNAGNAVTALEAPATAPAEKPAAPVPFSNPRPMSTFRVSWSTRLLTLWLVGVFVMLLRVLRLTFGVRRLRRQCERLEDASVSAMLEELKAAYGVSRRIAVLVSRELSSPAALGLFWPCILLPAAVATGLPPDQIRAVLAHELAHIRRHDYLVNFIQLVIEALFYFNPAVWWLSRQVRIEREACCDALAAHATGDVAHYAAALAQIARRLRPGGTPSAVPALASDTRPGSLIDRARRLLLPGYTPALRLRWHSVALGALLTLSLLLGLYQGSVVGVLAAGWFLSDADRAEAISQMSSDFQLGIKEDERLEEYTTFSGRIVTSDGKAPEGKKRLGWAVEAGNSTFSGCANLEGNRFEGRVNVGCLHVFAEFPGYAPVHVGPLQARKGTPVEPFEIRLDPAKVARIRFVDPDGKPVAGAEVHGGYRYLTNSWSGSIERTSDDLGYIQIEQASSPLPVAMRVKAEGFQATDVDWLVVQPGEVFVWTLQRDIPVEGVVVDRTTGSPVLGATVTLRYRDNGGCTDGAILRSGSDGRFQISGLGYLQTYYFVCQAPGYGAEVVGGAALWEPSLRVSLTPRYVRGRILGDLTRLETGSEGRPVVHYSMYLVFPLEQRSCGEGAEEIPVNDDGTFLIDGLRAGELAIQAGPKLVQMEVNDPVEDLVIDLDEKVARAERKLIVALPVPPGAPPASGTLRIEIADIDSRRFERAKPITVVDGHAEAALPVPARVRIFAEDLAGYIPARVTESEKEHLWPGWEINPDSEPYTITLPLERAGAIRGTVLLPDGSPANRAHVFARLRNAQVSWPSEYFCFGRDNAVCNASGEFAILPLPLDESVRLTVSVEFSRCDAEVRLSRGSPLEQVQLKLPAGMDVPIRVLKPDGRPMPGIDFSVETPDGDRFGRHTDSEGRCMLKGLDPAGEYTVHAEPKSHFQHTAMRLVCDGRENVLQLQEGLAVEGRVLMSGTEAPAAGVVLTVRNADYQTRVVTGADGRFRFSDLAPGKVSYSMDWQNPDLEFVLPYAEREFMAGQAEPLIIHVRKRAKS